MTSINKRIRDYRKGNIYKIEPIVEHDEGDIYIGSTTKDYLSQRMTTHRSQYKCWLNNKKVNFSSYLLFEKYGVDNCQIVLLELVVAETIDELLAREKYYIKTMQCVNKVVPMQTKKEYYETNKEIIKIKYKEYCENTKDKIKDRKKEYYEKNKEMLILQSKKYREKNKEMLILKRRKYREKIK